MAKHFDARGVGRWPKRLLLYRARTPFPKITSHPIEILGAGQQYVVSGLHPDTAKPYHWPLEETPLDVPVGDPDRSLVTVH